MADYKTVFSDSFRRILHMQGAGDVFFSDFYEKFISSSPEVAEKFEITDMGKQRKMLKASFYHMLTFFAAKEVPDKLVHIAETHNRHQYNIRGDLYDLWLECLIATVEKNDSQFTDDVELAWRLVMAKGITYMKFKHDH